MPLFKKENWLPSIHSLWLLPILTVAAYLRLYHLWEPVPTYWDDFAQEIIAPRNILDFHSNHWVFDLGRREPFFSYFIAALWWFLPTAKGLMVQRLGCVILNLATVWILYLVGKELSGRRAGILLAAFGAINLDLLLKCLVGMRIASLPLAVSLLILYTLRVLRRPGAKHFIQWGIAVAFGLYTYTAFRVFPPVVILGVWFFLLKPLRGVEGTTRAKFFSGSVLLLFILYYAEGNNLVPGGLFQDELVHSIYLTASVLLIFLVWFLSYILVPQDPNQRATVSWSGGVFLACLLGLPIVAQRSISEHMAGLSSFTLTFQGLGSLVAGASQKILGALNLLVGRGQDRVDLGPAGHSMLEGFVAVLLVAGGAYAIRQKNAQARLLLVLFAFGFLPYLLNVESHSGKLAGVVVPALALAVLGVENILQTGWVSKMGWPVKALVLTGIAALWGWAGYHHFVMVYKSWPTASRSLEFVAYQQVEQDLQDHFVYFGPFNQGKVSWQSLGVLQEGRVIHPFQDLNTILLDGTREIEGVIVYLAPSDEENLGHIEKLYPCILSEVKGAHQESLFLRVEIPLNQIRKYRKKDPLFVVRDLPEGLIHRRFYSVNYGLGRGLARGEDWVEDPNAPIPGWMKKDFGTLVEWDLDLKREEWLDPKPSGANPIRWLVDGMTTNGRRKLGPGKHRVGCFVELEYPEKGLEVPSEPALSEKR